MSRNPTGRLILVRHGESEGNRERRFTTSPTELPLTEIGREQAREAAGRIASLFAPALVITSPFARARHTAEIIAVELELSVEIEQELRERDVGEIAGEPYDAVLRHPAYDPAQYWLWRPPGGESLEEVRRRAAPVLDRLARRHSAKELVIVSHGGVMLSLWAHVTGSWEGARLVSNCGIVVVEHVAGRYRRPEFVTD